MYLPSKKSNQSTKSCTDISKFFYDDKRRVLIIKNFFLRVFIGIKKLLSLIDMAKQTDPNQRVIKFISKLEEEGGLDPISMQ